MLGTGRERDRAGGCRPGLLHAAPQHPLTKGPRTCASPSETLHKGFTLWKEALSGFFVHRASRLPRARHVSQCGAKSKVGARLLTAEEHHGHSSSCQASLRDVPTAGTPPTTASCPGLVPGLKTSISMIVLYDNSRAEQAKDSQRPKPSTLHLLSTLETKRHKKA